MNRSREKYSLCSVAKYEIFCFNYDDNVDMLRELGCTVKFFSPLKDSHIPGTHRMAYSLWWLELYAKKLS